MKPKDLLDYLETGDRTLEDLKAPGDDGFHLAQHAAFGGAYISADWRSAQSEYVWQRNTAQMMAGLQQAAQTNQGGR